MLKIIYNLICNIYSIYFTFFENFFLKKKILKKSNLEKKGFDIIKSISNPDIKLFDTTETLENNKYMKKKILAENNIYKLVNHFFIKNKFYLEISKLTGFNYSIDFMLYYQTFSIPDNLKNQEWYANNWHRDKPFSKNALKVIIPLKDINTKDDGGIKVLSLFQSSEFKKKKKIDKNFFTMIAKKYDVLLFKPNLCFHKAGNPKNSYVREQLMFQLNPSRNWCVNSNIFYKQKYLEPKFPKFSYFNDKKIFLNNL